VTREEAIDIRKFLQSRNNHLDPFRDKVRCFDYWIRDRAALDPRFVDNLAQVSRSLLVEAEAEFIRPALLSLAVVGKLSDCPNIARYACDSATLVADDAKICVKFLERRFKTFDQTRSEVGDQESFKAFAYALIDDRQRIDSGCDNTIEIWSDRSRQRWKSDSISDYLAGALSYFVVGEVKWERLTWQDIASFFDCGRTSDNPVTGHSSEAASWGEVTGHNSFVAFVRALIDDRRRAESIEATQRDKPAWAVEAAEGWQNTRISDFLGVAMLYFDIDGDAIPEPSWADLAASLFQGKIYE
jgi:hypothetical protein